MIRMSDVTDIFKGEFTLRNLITLFTLIIIPAVLHANLLDITSSFESFGETINERRYALLGDIAISHAIYLVTPTYIFLAVSILAIRGAISSKGESKLWMAVIAMPMAFVGVFSINLSSNYNSDNPQLALFKLANLDSFEEVQALPSWHPLRLMDNYYDLSGAVLFNSFEMNSADQRPFNGRLDENEFHLIGFYSRNPDMRYVFKTADPDDEEVWVIFLPARDIDRRSAEPSSLASSWGFEYMSMQDGDGINAFLIVTPLEMSRGIILIGIVMVILYGFILFYFRKNRTYVSYILTGRYKSKILSRIGIDLFASIFTIIILYILLLIFTEQFHKQFLLISIPLAFISANVRVAAIFGFAAFVPVVLANMGTYL